MTESNRPFTVSVRTQADNSAIRPISTGHAAYRQGTRTFRMGIGTDGYATIISIGNRIIVRCRIRFKFRSPEIISPAFINLNFYPSG